MYGHSDRMSIKKGGGCLMLFGLPFLAAGVGIIGAGLSGAMTSEDGSAAPLLFIIPFGLIFASVGAGVMFGRAGLTIDLTAKTITTWWGLLVPFKSTTHPLDKAEIVTICREVRRSKNSTYTVYPVRIKGFEKPVNIEEPRNYAAARRKAEEIAKFMNLGIEDTTSGKAVVREAGTLDESLREQAQRTGEAAEMPETPPDVKTKISVAGREATFEIPPTGFGLGEYVMLVVAGAALIGLVVAAVFFLGDGGPLSTDDEMGRYVFMAIGGVIGTVWLLIVVGIVFAAVKAGLSQEIVTVSPYALTQERRSPMGTKTKEIPAAELEELKIGLPDANRTPWTKSMIVARSDKETLEIGRGLEQKELEWLRDVIKFMSTA